MNKVPKFYTPYDIPEGWNDLSALKCEDVSLASQSDRDAADINNIVKQFGLTGELPYGIAVPVYADYSDIPNDYHAAQNFILDANDTFGELPANVRYRFNNDPGLFLDFVNNPDNYDEAEKLGIVTKSPSDLNVLGSKPEVIPQAEGA